jgi:hypothetical protein
VFPRTKIIAVDDERDELDKIVGSLRTLGLGCLAYRYPDDLPAADPQFSGIRALFLDIRLVGGTSPGQALNAPISLISRLIGEDNGPYALITWSSTDLHDQLIARINQTPSLKNRQPFYSCAFSKADLAGNPPRLQTEVQKLFTANAPFGSLLDWEARVARAGESVLQQLENLSSKLSGQTPRAQMDELLSRLAVASFGKANANRHKFEAVNEALLPMLGDELHNQFALAQPSKLWDKAITQCKAVRSIATELAGELNSKILLETGANLKSRRGAIIEVPSNWLPDPQFRRRFGATSSEIVSTLNLPQGAVPKWVLIQIQPACDYAQPKAAPIPFLLGTVVPASKKTIPGSVSLTPVFAAVHGLAQQPFKLAVFRTIPHTLAPSTLKHGTLRVLARLRDQLIESLIHDHHSHSSRPGFISFS